MPAIKCPACGYRHFQVVPACMNCGASFTASNSTSNVQQPHTPSRHTISSNSLAPTDPNDDDITAYEQFQNATTAPKEPNKPTRGSSQRTKNTISTRSQANNRALSQGLVTTNNSQPAPRQLWQKTTDLQMYEPYETMIDITPPNPFANDPGNALAIIPEGGEVVDWRAEKYPWYFPKTKPHVSGKVLHIESKEEIADFPDIFAALATLLMELLWVLINVQQQQRETDRVVMTTIRIQTTDGQLKDTRLRGNLRGATLSLGDQVTLWGVQRRGVLFIQRGYNHTTQSVISTHIAGMMIPSLFILLIIALLVYFSPTIFPYISHLFITFFGQYFSFMLHHPTLLPTQHTN
jgi:hypothetical protein